MLRDNETKIGNEVVSPLGLDHDIIYVSLNGSSDEVPEILEHTMLVYSPCIFQT